jgi:hypothetical protein
VNQIKKQIVILLSLLALTGLACGLGGQPQATPAPLGPPGGKIAVSDEAADRLKQNFYQALQEASGDREASLRITNEEISSLVASELTHTGQIPMENPQVWFTSGRIFITGQVNSVGPVNLDTTIVATALVDQGRMVVKVEEGQMGPFGLPDSLIESVTQTVNEALAGLQIDANLEITRLEILEGEMFVVGKRKGA